MRPNTGHNAFARVGGSHQVRARKGRWMAKDVLINAGAGEMRVAVLENGALDQLWMERIIGFDDGFAPKRAHNGGRSLVGDITLGRVQRVIPAMQAAFVNIGLERAGFLAAREARPRTAIFRDDPYTEEDRQLKISDFVREGDEILVQVVKDPIGEKGARLSANITIPGPAPDPGRQFAGRRALPPDRAGGGTGAPCRSCRADCRRPVGGDLSDAGFILRTAAIGADEAELREDAVRLCAAWRDIAQRR